MSSSAHPNGSLSSFSDFLRKCGAVLGAAGVGAGAFGAHALKEFLHKRGQTENWKTAVLYQIFHATALLGVAALCDNHNARQLLLMGNTEPKVKNFLSTPNSSSNSSIVVGGQLMAAGTLLFSGSIYLLCLGIGPKPILGPITPIGGFLLIGGWILVGFG